MPIICPNVEIFTAPGWSNKNSQKSINEDQIVATSYLYAVIDGATPLVNNAVFGPSSALFAANFVKKTLESCAASQDQASVYDNIVKANQLFKAELNRVAPTLGTEKHKIPSATVAAVQLHADNCYSYAQVADSMVIEVGEDQITVLGRDMFAEDDKALIQLSI